MISPLKCFLGEARAEQENDGDHDDGEEGVIVGEGVHRARIPGIDDDSDDDGDDDDEDVRARRDPDADDGVLEGPKIDGEVILALHYRKFCEILE